jgi:diguanylate cyclase (GGDEF)-like protein/PAS domain S-box-containing protein
MPMGLTLPSQSPLRWVQAVMGEGAAHRRVRVAMYSMLVLLASLAIMRAFRIGQSEQVRQMDMEIIRVAGAQSALTQRMGLQAAQFVLHPANTREEADYLADTLRLSQLQAQQLEDLLAKLTPLAPQTPEAVTQALRGWQDSREALWYRVQAVLWQVQQHDSVAMTHAIGQLQNELDTSQLSSAALVEAIQDAARGRSERTVTQIRMLTVGAIVLFVLMGFFIIEPTARAVRRQYRALARQTERLQRLAMVAELSSNAIAITDSKNRVEWVNQAFTALTDYTQKQARGRRIGTLLKARSVEPARFAEFAMALRKGVGIQREIRITARRSELGWVRVDMQPIHDSGGALNGWVLVATDLTEVREQQQLLELAVDGAGLGIWHWDMVGGTMDCNVRMLTILGYAAGEMDMSAAAWMDMIHPDDQGAWTDSLRRHLRDRTQAHPGYNFAVLFMDFDRFKQVNDTLGHSVGDELLRQIARRLQDSLRPGDSFVHTSDFEQMAARIGGDEFVVLLDDIRGDLDAEIVAGRLLDVLAVPYQVSTHRVSSTVSIGIVTSTHAEQDADSVLRDADIAMYEAKRSGRARYAMFDPGMRMRVSASVSLENDLRQALANGEMYVVYQPVLHLPATTLAGVEALVRWRHPQRGLVPPVDFIPLAEACGLIDALGQYVLREACHAFDAMQQQLGALAPPTMAVNLSRAQLRQPGLVSDIVDAVRASNMSPHQLVLEVTESLAAQDAEVQSTLREIRALGVGLSLDDFGTGYSSLSCLHELPVNTVKIDRSFVSQASQSEYHRVLIEATLRVARTLGLDTVAEGIETPEQASLMASMGCKKGQGFLFSKPLELADLIAWAQRVPPSPSS